MFVSYAIHDRLGNQIGGLYHQSSIDNRIMITLFDRSRSEPSFPALALFSALLNHDAMAPIIDEAVERLGYGVI